MAPSGTDRSGLDLLESATAPHTTVRTPFTWSADPSWKKDFWSLDASTEQLARQKEEFDRQKAIARQKREAER